MRRRFAEFLGLDPSGLSSLIVSQPVALASGFVASIWLILWRARRAGFRRRDTLELLIAAYLGALALGRLLDMLMWGEAFWRQPWRIVDPWFGSASTLGGLIGAGLGMLLWSKRLNINGLRFVDAAAPAAGLAVFFFKSACLLAGCCFGSRTTGLLGTRFPPRSLVYYDQLGQGLIAPHYQLSLPVHPVQAYEALWALAVFALLLLLSSRLQSRAGVLSGLGAVLLLGGRFVVEFFRAAAHPLALGLSLGQWTCLLAAATVVTVAVHPRLRQGLRHWSQPSSGGSDLSHDPAL